MVEVLTKNETQRQTIQDVDGENDGVVYPTDARWGFRVDVATDSNTDILQQFIQDVVDEQLTGRITRRTIITKPLRIGTTSGGVALGFSLKTSAGLNTVSTRPVGGRIHWGGSDAFAGPMVEINEIQSSQIDLSLSNSYATNPNIDGILMRNRADNQVASNGNICSFWLNGFNHGLRIGDNDGDGYHSNYDDNSFPYLTTFNTRNPLLIDSRAQDNLHFDNVHFGGASAQADESREYLIRCKRNGNNFHIGKAFVRTDKMVTDAIAFDIQEGGINCEQLSVEGSQRRVMLLRLNGGPTRDTSVIKKLTCPPPRPQDVGSFHNSDGICVESHAVFAPVFLGCIFGGDLGHSTPIVEVGNNYHDNFGNVDVDSSGARI